MSFIYDTDHLNIVQENVELSNPNVPHAPTRGGIIIPKLNNHILKSMIPIFIFVYILP